MQGPRPRYHHHMTPTRSGARDNAGALPRYALAELIALLDAEYGRIPLRPHGDPMAELVLTLLSQNTSDHNSGRAFQRLLARFPGWDAVLAAPTADVEEAIRPGGLAPTKAPRLQALIATVRQQTATRDRGKPYDLRFLEALPLAEAKVWLRGLPGIGRRHEHGPTALLPRDDDHGEHGVRMAQAAVQRELAEERRGVGKLQELA